MSETLTSPKYVNAENGIQATDRETGRDVYLEPGSDLHTRAVAEEWGPVAAFVAEQPPDPVALWRASASLTFAQFAIVASQSPYDWFTRQEAKALTQRNSVPVAIRVAMAALPNADETEMRLWGGDAIYRTGTFVALMQSTMSISDADMDQAFRDGASL